MKFSDAVLKLLEKRSADIQKSIWKTGESSENREAIIGTKLEVDRIIRAVKELQQAHEEDEIDETQTLDEQVAKPKTVRQTKPRGWVNP